MRKRLWLGTVGAVAGLAALAGTSGAANASCSLATLTGEYAFGVTVYSPPFNPGGPHQVVEGVKFFDGNGHLTQRDYRGGTLPAEFAPPPGGTETGTYTVDPDCTGSLDITEVFPARPTVEIQALIVISNGGRHIHEVVSQFIVGGHPSPTPPKRVLTIGRSSRTTLNNRRQRPGRMRKAGRSAAIWGTTIEVTA